MRTFYISFLCTIVTPSKQTNRKTILEENIEHSIIWHRLICNRYTFDTKIGSNSILFWCYRKHSTYPYFFIFRKYEWSFLRAGQVVDADHFLKAFSFVRNRLTDILDYPWGKLTAAFHKEFLSLRGARF